MKQDELWQSKYHEVWAFIEMNKRNPSKYYAEERGKYCNWMKHNKKVFAAGEMKEDRVVKFKALIELCEQYKRKNQYQ